MKEVILVGVRYRKVRRNTARTGPCSDSRQRSFVGRGRELSDYTVVGQQIVTSANWECCGRGQRRR
jgi:hypothetical protein